MKKLLILGLFFLVGCGQSQLRNDDSHFMAKNELNVMMKTFYRNPKPGLVLAFFDEINKQVKDPNTKYLMVPFAGEVFKKYPTESIMWSHRMIEWNLSLVAENLFWSALKYSELKVFNEIKDKAMEEANGRRRDAIANAEIFNKKDYFKNTTPKEASEVDSLWGRFFATGNKVALQKIITALEVKPKATFADSNLVTVVTWSIMANAKEDSNLLVLLKTELKGNYSKQVKASLAKIISDVEGT